MIRHIQPRWRLTALCLFALLAGCERHQPEQGEPREEDARAATIRMASATQQALGLRVAPAELKALEQTLQLTGQIAQDTDRLVHVNAPEAGTLQELLVTIGQQVEAQAPVAILASNPSGTPVQVTAPRSGLVLGLHTSVGAAVDPLTSLMTIADLSQVWATFDVYEQDIALVQVNQRLEVQSVAYPDRMFPGKIVFVSPQVDQHTRTIKLRAQVENPDYALKLGMFVTGTLYIPTAEQALIVPHEAIQRIEGQRVVFVQVGPETFQPRDVQVGQESARGVQILEGVQPGEPVVAAGSFHLKGELLKGTLEESD